MRKSVDGRDQDFLTQILHLNFKENVEKMMW